MRQRRQSAEPEFHVGVIKFDLYLNTGVTTIVNFNLTDVLPRRRGTRRLIHGPSRLRRKRVLVTMWL